MRLTQRTDYALRMLMHLAVDTDGASVPEIASRFGLSEHHLMKVAQALSGAGWVKTQRGRGGGVALAVSPETVRIGDVVRYFEPDFRLVECFEPEDNRCVITEACGLQGTLQHALRLFLDHLDTVTLAHLTEDRETLARLLQIQTAATA
jgi:Rrf2 family nitric oxide-sensitive transcriptional repressor